MINHRRRMNTMQDMYKTLSTSTERELRKKMTKITLDKIQTTHELLKSKRNYYNES